MLTFCLFLLLLKDTACGTFGYMSTGNISPLLRQTQIFASIVPVTVNLREGEDATRAARRPEIVTTNQEVDLAIADENGLFVTITGTGMNLFSANSKRFDE